MPPTIDGPGPLAAYALGVAEQRLNPPAGHLVALVGDGERVARMAAVALPDGIDDMDGWVIRSLPGLYEAVAAVADLGADRPTVFLVAFADPPRIDYVETVTALTVMHDAIDEDDDARAKVHESLVVDPADRTFASILTADDPAPIPDLPDLPPARDLSQVPTVDDDDPTLAPRIPAQETQA